MLSGIEIFKFFVSDHLNLIRTGGNTNDNCHILGFNLIFDKI